MQNQLHTTQYGDKDISEHQNGCHNVSPSPGTTALLPLSFGPAPLHIPLAMEGSRGLLTPVRVLWTHGTVRITTAPDHAVHDLARRLLRLKVRPVAQFALARTIETEEELFRPSPE